MGSGHPNEVATPEMWLSGRILPRIFQGGTGTQWQSSGLACSSPVFDEQHRMKERRGGSRPAALGTPAPRSSPAKRSPAAGQLLAWGCRAGAGSRSLTSQPMYSLHRLSPACPGASFQQTFHFVPGCPWLSVQTPPPATEDKFLPRRPLRAAGLISELQPLPQLGPSPHRGHQGLQIYTLARN